MLGDRASGMGGAYTAMTDDPAASPYYNPAALARLHGNSLSTAVSLFNKYDSSYGDQPSLNDSIFRINRGKILSIPASSAIISSFHNFSAGVSILLPEYQNFGGTIHSSGTDSTFLRLDNQNLWVGGAFALNVTDNDALGFSAHYTSQNTARSSTNLFAAGGGTTVENEELTLATNSVIYQLGYFHEFAKTEQENKWRLGLSYRFRSILVAGSGSYLFSSVSTVSGASTPIQKNSLSAFSYVPDRLAMGLSCTTQHQQTYSFDISYYGSNHFSDLEQDGDVIVQKNIFNFALGYENQLEPWLALRLGLFTDYSAAPGIPANPSMRYQDHIDKFGFSANFGIQTTDHTRLSLGGYYLGGTGDTAEKIGAAYTPLTKTDRVFSFLVGSSYWF